MKNCESTGSRLIDVALGKRVAAADAERAAGDAETLRTVTGTSAEGTRHHRSERDARKEDEDDRQGFGHACILGRRFGYRTQLFPSPILGT